MPTIVGQKKGKKVKYQGGNGEFTVSIPLSFIVYDESGVSKEGDILSTVGLPQLNRTWVIDGINSTLVCRSKEAEQWDSNNKYWTVNCELVTADMPTLPGGGGGGGSEENDPPDPKTWTPLINLEYETIERPIYTDIFGTPILNLAKRSYASPKTRKVLVPCITFTQYEDPNQRLIDILQRNESINVSSFFGGMVGSWLLTVDDCDLGYKNGFLCWRIDYKIRYLTFNISLIQDYVYTNIATGQTVLATQAGIVEDGRISGWLDVLPQEDYIDVEGRPVVDINGNQIYGKLDVSGIRVAGTDQGTAQTIYLVHQEFPYLEFNGFLRINQEQ